MHNKDFSIMSTGTIVLKAPVLSFESFDAPQPTHAVLDRVCKLSTRFAALSQEDSVLSADVLKIAMDTVEDAEIPDGPVPTEDTADGTDPNLSTEGWAANTKSILMRAGKMVIDFIAKAVRWVMNYLGDYERSVRMRKTKAGKQLIELNTKLSRGTKDFVVDVSGDGLTMLSFGPTVPNGPGEVAVAWKSFVRDTFSPYAEWLKNVATTMGVVATCLNKIFNARDIMEPDAAAFTELENIAFPVGPKGWRKLFNFKPINGGDAFVPPSEMWGNPTTVVGSAFMVVGGGVVPGILAAYAQPLVPEEIDDDQTISLTAPTMLEFAKCAIGALDLLSSSKAVHNVINDMGKKLLTGYTYRFIDTNEDGDPQELERRNKIINDVVGTMSYVMNTTSVMSDYLFRFQTTVYLLGEQVIKSVEASDKVAGV